MQAAAIDDDPKETSAALYGAVYGPGEGSIADPRKARCSVRGWASGVKAVIHLSLFWGGIEE